MNVKAFFNLFEKLLEDLENSFPSQRTRIYKYKSAVNLSKNTNGRLFINNFAEYVNPYRDYIINCDEKHFLNKQPDHFGASGEAAEICNLIKEIWKQDTTTQKTKAAIWAYLQNLIKLSDNI